MENNNAEKLLQHVQEVLSERRKQYHKIDPFVEKVATLWRIILGKEVTKEQMLLCMVAFKIVRFQSSLNESERKDSLTDMIGYAALIDELLAEVKGS